MCPINNIGTLSDAYGSSSRCTGFLLSSVRAKIQKKIRTAGNKWIFRSINHKEHQKPKNMRRLGKLAVAAVLIIAGTTLANKTLASAGAKMMGF